MKKITINLSLIFLVMIVLVYGEYVWANKSTTSIEVPESIPKGSEITIRVMVTHNANNFMHYTKVRMSWREHGFRANMLR